MMQSVEIGGKEYDPKGLTILSTAKNRHGATKNTALNFKGSCMHFTDHWLDTPIQDESTWTPYTGD
jgi:hypothetical protein